MWSKVQVAKRPRQAYATCHSPAQRPHRDAAQSTIHAPPFFFFFPSQTTPVTPTLFQAPARQPLAFLCLGWRVVVMDTRGHTPPGHEYAALKVVMLRCQLII